MSAVRMYYMHLYGRHAEWRLGTNDVSLGSGTGYWIKAGLHGPLYGWRVVHLIILASCCMEQELKEKKKWGRLQKAKGDMALLAGSPRDAFEHYKCALELSTKSSDFIW